MVYLDNASTTYMYPEVIGYMNDLNKYLYGNPSNLHSMGVSAKEVLEEARKSIADTLNIEPEQIIFTSCASESNALVIHQSKVNGHRAWVSTFDHSDITHNPDTILVDEDTILNLKSVESFLVSPNALENLICSHLWVSNITGEIFDLAPMAEACHYFKGKFLMDGTQALGNIKVDLKDTFADYISFSLHKAHGPKGVGLLITKQKKEELVPLIPGSQESKRRGGTENVVGIAGAAKALKRACEEQEEKQIHCKKLREQLINSLKEAEIDFLVNEGRHNISSILNLAFAGITGDGLMLELNNRGTIVSTGSACDSGNFEPPATLVAMKVPEKYIQGAIRISMDLNTTTDDISMLGKQIKNIIKGE